MPIDETMQEEIRQMVASEVAARLAGFSSVGHRHDGFEEMRVLMSHLESDQGARGRLPFNYRYEAETASDSLTPGATDVTLLTAAITPHLKSNILVAAFVQYNNDAATVRQITTKIKRGATTLVTAVSQLRADADNKVVVTPFVVEHPNSREAITYTLTGASDAATPTATNKALFVLELPLRLSNNA